MRRNTSWCYCSGRNDNGASGTSTTTTSNPRYKAIPPSSSLPREDEETAAASSPYQHQTSWSSPKQMSDKPAPRTTLLKTSISSPEICCLCRSEKIVGNAFDLVLVETSTRTTTSSSTRASQPSLACNDVIVYFGPTVGPTCADLTRYRLILRVEEHTITTTTTAIDHYHDDSNHHAKFIPHHVDFRIVGKAIRKIHEDSLHHERNNDNEPGNYCHDNTNSNHNSQHDTRALEELRQYLHPGKNSARYLLMDEYNEIVGVAPVDIYLWYSEDRVCIVDIDGTITKSNVRGLLDTIFVPSYSYIHQGICKFLTNLQEINDVRLVFVTSRPISIANFTRQIFLETKQNENTLPHGPVIGFPGSLAEIMEMELISQSVNKFKLSALEYQIIRPFQLVGGSNPLRAGIGNSLMDMQAYSEAGIHLSGCYLIGKDSIIFCLDNESHQDSTGQGRSRFLSARGTRFIGYNDEKLLLHVSRNLTTLANR